MLLADRGIAETSPRRRIILAALVAVFVLSGVNAICNSIQFAFNGHGGTYLFRGDTIADFVKVALSYPGAPDVVGLSKALRGYLADNIYGGLEALELGRLTHFHLPPFTTALTLASLWVIVHLGPEPTYVIAVVLLAAGYVLLAREVVRRTGDWVLLALCLFLSYPFLFALQRGNVFAALTSLLTTWALVLLRKRKATFAALLLLAVAMNIRPNVALLAAPILVWTTRPARSVLILAALAAAVFATSLGVVAAVYPAYSLRSFARGLEIYHRLYVIGDRGLGYSSSLYTLVKWIAVQAGLGRKYLGAVEALFSALAALVVLAATWQRSRCRLRDPEYVFVITAAGMLGTAVYGDYHLLAFAAPLLMLLVEVEEVPERAGAGWLDRRLQAVLWVTAFLLGPKNYLRVDGVFLLAFANTLVCVAFVAQLLRRPSVAGVGEEPARTATA